MADDQQPIAGFDSRPDADGALRNERREFFRAAIGAVAVTAAGASALAIATSASAATIADNDMVNFLLQLEYLAAQYYSFSVNGVGLPAAQLTGLSTDTAGQATGARKVTFTDPLVGQYAAEIAQDLAAHVSWLRTTLGTDGTRAQPAIDLGTAATGAFSKLAAAADIVADGASFDPYASDNNFLLGAFMFEDVIVTAYAGASASITDKTLLGSIMGLLSSHAHHTAVIRGLLYDRGVATPALRTNADSVSDVRDILDGVGAGADIDQGISPATVNEKIVSNIAPTAPNGVVLGRSTSQVLNEFYLNSGIATAGGFYPAGLNGAVKSSATH